MPRPTPLNTLPIFLACERTILSAQARRPVKSLPLWRRSAGLPGWFILCMTAVTVHHADRRGACSHQAMSATTATPISEHSAAAATRLIVAASLGNALEFYEILVYGYFAVIISKVFFPAADEAVSLLVTFGTFGASFLARPVGAIFLGAYGDRMGRKAGTDAVDPADDDRHRADDHHAELRLDRHCGADIGHRRAAVAGIFGRRRVRQFDRFSGRASSRPRRLFASWQWASQGLAAVVATSLGVLLTTTMSARRPAGLRLAHSFCGRALDRAGRLLHPQQHGGNAGIPWTPAPRARRCAIFWSANGTGSCSPSARS